MVVVSPGFSASTFGPGGLRGGWPGTRPGCILMTLVEDLP